MFRTLTILFLLVFGILVNSNSVYACGKSVAKAEKSSKIHHKESKSIASNCCTEETKDIEHDCNKKCKDHHCDCTTISSFSLLNESLIADLSIVSYPTQKCFSLYKSSFYNDVYISIWHPPKIV